MFVMFARFDIKAVTPVALKDISYLEPKGGHLTETKNERDRVPVYTGVYLTGHGRPHYLPVKGTIEEVLEQIEAAMKKAGCDGGCHDKKDDAPKIGSSISDPLDEQD